MKVSDETIEEIEHLRPIEAYHYICYGGSACKQVDAWGINETFKCNYAYRDNHLTPKCRECNGNVKGFPDLNDYYRGYDNCISDILILLS